MYRRKLLKLGAASSGVCLLANEFPNAFSCRAWAAANKNQAIINENARSGTREWMLVNTRIDPATKYRSPWIEGYASEASVSTGQNLQIMVSTDPVSEFLSTSIDLVIMQVLVVGWCTAVES